jgi:aminoglycoside 6'-N-acetyltransferase
VIRRYREADLDLLLAIVKQPEVEHWWDAYDRRKLRQEIAEATLSWTIVVDDRPAGLINVWEQKQKWCRHVDIDIFLDSALHSQGIGSDSMRQALRMMFEGRRHHRATLSTSPENAHAIRCYERIGFRKIGVARRADLWSDGEWRDELLMDLLAEDLS